MTDGSFGPLGSHNQAHDAVAGAISLASSKHAWGVAITPTGTLVLQTTADGLEPGGFGQ